MMRISVIICTRNRAEQLRRVLDSAAAMTVPEGLNWELMVVDNGSADNTRDVVQSYRDRLPIRCVTEYQPGLSNARNSGVSEAVGDYICWTDDDVLIDRHWLAAYAHAFDRHPGAAYFGGPIELVLEPPTPDWLKQNRAMLASALAERMLGDDPVVLDPTTDLVPYGANYAVRAREQRAQQYDRNLGVSPVQRRLGEETTLLTALHRDGGEGWWVPEARVRHVIPPERQTLRYFLDYQRSLGETAAYLADQALHDQAGQPARAVDPSVRRRSVYLRLQEAAHLLVYLALRPTGKSSKWMHHLLRSGYFGGAVQFSRNKRDAPRRNP